MGAAAAHLHAPLFGHLVHCGKDRSRGVAAPILGQRRAEDGERHEGGLAAAGAGLDVEEGTHAAEDCHTGRAASVRCSVRGKRAGTRRTGFELLLLEHALLHGGTVGDEDAALHAHLGEVRGKAAAGPVLNVEEEQLRRSNEAPLLSHGGALAAVEHGEDGEVVRGAAELDAQGLHCDGHRCFLESVRLLKVFAF